MRNLTPDDFADGEVVVDAERAINGRVVGRTRAGVRVEWDAVGGGHEPPIEVPAARIEKPEGRTAYLERTPEAPR